MGDRGTQAYAYSGETTEWEDILVKKGVVSREQVFAAKGLDARDFPDAKAQQEQERRLQQQAAAEGKEAGEHPLARATLEEMDEAEDDLDDDAALARYREARLRELKAQRVRERFGEVVEISKADWLREVTEGSKASVGEGEGGEGTWVVVHLYQDRIEECRLLNEQVLPPVARKFKAVKFVKIVATSAVENWPDRNLPALFVYRGGELQTQLLGVKRLGGRGATADDLEWYLAQQGVVASEMEEDPRSKKAGGSGLPRSAARGARRGYDEGGEESD